jgi:hypothetical protein
MPRTTLDLDAGVLLELKRRRRTSGKSIGQIASELLAGALHDPGSPAPRRLRWRTAPMGARLDIDDKEAVRRALEGR